MAPKEGLGILSQKKYFLILDSIKILSSRRIFFQIHKHKNLKLRANTYIQIHTQHPNSMVIAKLNYPSCRIREIF